MASPPTDLHFILFPLIAPGHMIPMVDIARILARTGATVTIITTPVNSNRFKPAMARATKAKLKIQVLELHLPLAEFGLPEGHESFDMLPSADLYMKLFAATNTLEQPSEKMLRRLSPAPSCIISDNLFPWTNGVARRLNVPRLVFHGPGCFTFLCIHIVMHTNVLDQIALDTDRFVVPGLSHRIELTKAQAGNWGKKDTKEVADMFERMEESEAAADGIVVNSFRELEGEYVEELTKAKGKKVWCIGPVSLGNTSFLDVAERGNKAGINEHDCLKWLDSREPGCVIYVCLGSTSRSSTKQMIELALGLELSNVPFIWCIRHPTEEFERWFLKEGLEERVKDHGLMIRGWAPQVLILSHRAVGGFLTHCGWNSTLEGVSAGVPMVTWPHFADQFINERFITDVLKIGVAVGMEVPVMAGEQDNVGVLVKKEGIKIAIEGLMDKGEEGETRRKRARELGEMAKRAMAEGGSSHHNMMFMIQDIIEKLAKNTKPIQESVSQL